MVKAKCVLLANRHLGLTEGLHGLLETLFGTVVMVADAFSLKESARRLRPEVAVVDLSLARDCTLGWLRELRDSCPGIKVVVIGVHDEPMARQAVLDNGADQYVLKRSIATDLLSTIDELLAECPDDMRGENVAPDAH